MSKVKVIGTGFIGINALEKFKAINEFDAETIAIAVHHSSLDIYSADIKIDVGREERFGLDGGSPQRSESFGKVDNVMRIDMEYFFRTLSPKTKLTVAFDLIEHYIVEAASDILHSYSQLSSTSALPR